MPVTIDFQGKSYTLSQAAAWVDALYNHLCSQLLPAPGWEWIDDPEPAMQALRHPVSLLKDDSGEVRGTVIRRADGTFEAWIVIPGGRERVHNKLGAEAIEDVNDGKYYVADSIRETLGISWAKPVDLAAGLKPEAPSGG